MNIQKPLSQHERIRRVMILCCHALINFAFYKSGWKIRQPLARNQFWVEVNGAFLDRAILEWCKLFADKKERHHWRQVNQYDFALSNSSNGRWLCTAR